MRYCKNCGIKLANDLEYCPVCDMATTELDGEYSQDYPHVKKRFGGGFFFKAVTYTVVVTIILCFLVDHLIPYSGSWPFFATWGILYGWLTFAVVLRRPNDPGAVVFSQLLLLSFLTVAIDMLCGWLKWSVNYVIPGLVTAAAIAIVLCIALRPDRFRAYTIYQMFIALAGLVPVFLWLGGCSEIEWTALTAAAVAVLCFTTILVFSHRHTTSELGKRFHV